MKSPDLITQNLMQNRTAAEHVFDLLRREIITGRAQPGQRLIERDLTDRFGVSRTPVREALRRLVSTQLAVNVPYRGIMVQQLSLGFAHDIYDLRLGLEGLASYLAAKRGTDEEHAELSNTFHKIDVLTKRGDRDEIMLLNNDFHLLIAKASHNELLVERVEEIWTTVNLVRGAAWQGTVRAEGSRAEHEAITKAILSRDAEAARRATERHIRNSWITVERALEEQQVA